MLILFTDFGWQDTYVGQVKAVLHAEAPDQPVIDLLHSVPAYNAHAGAHLIDALCRQFPVGSVFLCVVDPGVGGDRQALVVEADGRYFVGPDNGLLSVVAGRATASRCWQIVWRPERLSGSFHGRDLFAPVAARIAQQGLPDDWLVEADATVQFDTADLPRVLYIDHYGNAWTGIRAGLCDPGMTVLIRGKTLPYRRVYSDAEKGEMFWYVNSVGLLEIAVNRGSAAEMAGLNVGDLVKLSGSPDSRLH